MGEIRFLTSDGAPVAYPDMLRKVRDYLAKERQKVNSDDIDVLKGAVESYLLREHIRVEGASRPEAVELLSRDAADMYFQTSTGAPIPYEELLQRIQEFLATSHSDTIAAAPDNSVLLKSYIERYMQNAGIKVVNATTSEAVERLYQDAAGTGYLSEYLGDLKKLEEVNINAWDSAVVTMADGSTHYAARKFLSPEHADTILSNMVKNHGGLIDAAAPAAKVTIAKNTRMTIAKYPLVDPEVGWVASIRTVNTSELNEDVFLKEGTATIEELDFLLFCIFHGISIIFAGEPGAGKTATAGWLLSKLYSAQQEYEDHRRLITIEHETREFNFRRFGLDGRQNNDVVHFITRPSEKPEMNYDIIKLIVMAKTFHPGYLGIGEIVGAESFEARIATKSFPVISTTHSLFAPDTYEELADLAKLHPVAATYSEEYLTASMIKAFPLVVYVKQLKDRSRRIMDIYEGEKIENGEVVGHSIYRFNIRNNVRKGKKLIVNGQHERVGGLSERLQRMLLNNGASSEEISRFV